MSVSAASLVADVSVTGAAGAITDLLRTGMAADTAGESFKAIAGGALLLAGAAIVGIGVKAVQMAGNFQEGLTRLVTGAGESQKNLQLVSNGILDIATQTGTSTADLSTAMFTVESSGAHGAAGLAILTAAAEGAKVGNANLAGVTDVLTTSIHNYHLSASAATGVVNSFIATTSAGKMVMDDLNGALTNVLPIAAQAHVALGGVEGALATMSLAGDKGSAAGTHLSQMLMSLIKPSTAATKELSTVGLTTQKISDEMKVSLPGTIAMITDAVGKKFPAGSPAYLAAIANIVGGSKQMKAIMELSGDSLKTFIADTKATGDALNKGGNAVTGWNLVQGDFNFKMSQAREVVETLMIKIGTALLPVLTNLMNIVIPLITQFSNWFTSSGVLGTAIQDLSGFFTMLGGYIQPIVKDIQSAAQAFFGFGDAAKQTSDTVTGAVKPISETVRHLQGMLGNIMGGTGAKTSPFAAIMADAKQFATVIMSDVKPLFADLGQMFGTIATSAMGFGRVLLTNIVPVFQGLASVALPFIASLKGPLSEAFHSISQTIGGVFSSHMKMASGLVQELGKWFQTTLLPAIKQAMPGFQSLAGVLISTVVPGLFKLWAIGQKVIDEVLPPLVHVMEAVIPVAIKLGGIIAGGLAASLKFLMPYILQAASAIGQFAGEIATRIAPILINFFHQISTGLDDFMAIWKMVWPYLAPILKGVWDEIVGIIKIAWAIVSGIFKIALDLLSGNWSQAWTDLKTMLSGIWDGIKTVLKGFLEIITGWLSVAWALIKAGAEKVWGGIASFFSGLWAKISSGVTSFLGAIGGFFSAAWDNIKKLATTFWDDEKKGWQLIWDDVKKLVQTGWSDVTGFFTSAFDKIKNFAATFWDDEKRGWQNIWATVKNLVQTGWNDVVAQFTGAWGKVKAALSSLWTNVTGVFNGYLKNMEDFGANLIKNLAKGITGAIGDVTGAIGNVTKAIGNFLPHSPAKEGELQHLNEYGPTIGKALVRGLQDQIPTVKAAMQVMVKPMAAAGGAASGSGSFSGASSAMAFPTMQSAQPNITVVVQSPDLNLDGMRVTRQLMPHIVNNIRNSTGSRAY